MAAPRKKPPVKKAPAKKPPVKKPDVKSPAETRKPISRKQMGTNRLQNLINEGAEGRRLSVQGSNPKQLNFSYTEPKPQKTGRPNRATTPRVINQGYTPGSASRAVVPSTSASATSSAGSKTLAFLRGVGSRAAGAAGAIVDPTFLSGKGEGKLNNDPVTRYLEDISTMSAMNKKMKREIRQGPALAVTGVKEGVIGKTRSLRNKTGQNRPEYPTWRNKPKVSESSSSSTYSGYGTSNIPKKIRNPYSGYGTSNVPKKEKSEASGATQKGPTTTRPKPLNTLAADYAAKQQGQNQGQAKAKSAATTPNPPRPPNQVAKSAPVKKVGRLTRAEREGLSTDRMQRKPKGNLLGFLKKRK